jgi:hypothetical protein
MTNSEINFRQNAVLYIIIEVCPGPLHIGGTEGMAKFDPNFGFEPDD